MYIKHKTRHWSVIVEPEEVVRLGLDSDYSVCVDGIPAEDASHCVVVSCRRGDTTILSCDTEEEAIRLYERLQREVEKVISYVSADQRMDLGEVVPE